VAFFGAADATARVHEIDWWRICDLATLGTRAAEVDADDRFRQHRYTGGGE